MTQSKPGHNITEKAYFVADSMADVMLFCTCGELLHQDDHMDLQEALKAIAEHNQKYVPTGVRL